MERRIGLEIKQLSNLIKRSLDAHQAQPPQGITAVQGWVIGYLYEHGVLARQAVFQRDLEREFQIRRSSVTGLLQTMEKNGLIVREAVDHDARLKKLTLTERGIELFERTAAALNACERRLAEGIDPQELAVFWRVMDRIRENAMRE